MDEITPTVINASDQLLNELVSAGVSWLRGVHDDELVSFEGGYQPTSTQALLINASEVPELAATYPKLQPPDQSNMFHLKKTALSHVRGYSLSIQLGKDVWIHFFRRLTRSSLRFQRKGGVDAILVGNQYDLVPEEGLHLETDFDAAVIGSQVVIRHRGSFERMFNFAQMTTERAAASAREVVSGLNIVGVEDLIRVVSSDQRMHGKLDSAAEKLRDLDYRSRVSTTTIAELVNARNDIDLEIRQSNGQPEMVFDDSPQRRWTIIKILDDDYLISELTDTRYQAPSKHSGSP